MRRANHCCLVVVSLLAALGFLDGRTPRQSTLQRLFRRLDGDALAAALTAYIAPFAIPAVPAVSAARIDPLRALKTE